MSAFSRTPSFEVSELNLSPTEQDAITVAATKVARFSLLDDPEAFVTEAQIQAATLPQSLRRSVLAFKRWGNRRGGMLIRGLPVDFVPPTPSRASDSAGISLFATAVLSLMAALLGDQYGFLPELGGNLQQDILPEKGAEDTQRSVSSKTRLFDHIEHAFSPLRCDYVGLLCVRQDHEGVAGTTLSSIHDILPKVSEQTIELLGKELFKTTVDESFLLGLGHAGPIWIGPISVLGGSAERPTLRVDFAETVGLTPAAQAALDELAEVADAVKTTAYLAAGDLVWTDNQAAFHGRTAFTPRWDGHDRWLLRAFVTRDLHRSAAARPGDGRVIDTDYVAGPDVMLIDLHEAA